MMFTCQIVLFAAASQTVLICTVQLLHLLIMMSGGVQSSEVVAWNGGEGAKLHQIDGGGGRFKWRHAA